MCTTCFSYDLLQLRPAAVTTCFSYGLLQLRPALVTAFSVRGLVRELAVYQLDLTLPFKAVVLLRGRPCDKLYLATGRLYLATNVTLPRYQRDFTSLPT